jgi:hypothetical protein
MLRSNDRIRTPTIVVRVAASDCLESATGLADRCVLGGIRSDASTSQRLRSRFPAAAAFANGDAAMQWDRKALAPWTVLAVGIGLALLFFRRDPPPADRPSYAVEPLLRHEAVRPQFTLQPPSPDRRPERVDAPAASALRLPSVSLSAFDQADPSPPALAPDYPGAHGYSLPPERRRTAPR